MTSPIAGERLDAAIMNLPCGKPAPFGLTVEDAYKMGHRDARHAAAEIVAAALLEPVEDEQIRSLWQTTDTGDIEEDILSFARSLLSMKAKS